MKQILFSLFAIILINIACSSSKKANSVSEIQGIQGIVTEVTGNQMPMMGEPKPQPNGIKTTVFIYEKTNVNQVTQIGSSPIYTIINTKQVAFVETDSSGAFTLALPVGSYSLFIKQGNQFYANLFDSDNNIALFTVEEGKLTQVSLQINNSATY